MNGASYATCLAVARPMQTSNLFVCIPAPPPSSLDPAHLNVPGRRERSLSQGARCDGPCHPARSVNGVTLPDGSGLRSGVRVGRSPLSKLFRRRENSLPGQVEGYTDGPVRTARRTLALLRPVSRAAPTSWSAPAWIFPGPLNVATPGGPWRRRVSGPATACRSCLQPADPDAQRPWRSAERTQKKTIYSVSGSQ